MSELDLKAIRQRCERAIIVFGPTADASESASEVLALLDRCEAAEAGIRMLRCTETKSGKHEWRGGLEWDDPQPVAWCCRCALTADQIIDRTFSATADLVKP